MDSMSAARVLMNEFSDGEDEHINDSDFDEGYETVDEPLSTDSNNGDIESAVVSAEDCTEVENNGGDETVDEPLRTDSNNGDIESAVVSAEDCMEVENNGDSIPDNVDQTMEADSDSDYGAVSAEATNPQMPPPAAQMPLRELLEQVTFGALQLEYLNFVRLLAKKGQLLQYT